MVNPMNFWTILLPKVTRLAVVTMAGLHLAACSKSVEWQEEVPLNTGATIVVHRAVTYSLKGGAGNPLDMAYRPDRDESLKFDWNGKQYTYRGDALLMLLAIAPDGTPTLVARAEDKSWNFKNAYGCTTPFYVQFTPQADRQTWKWPVGIEPWLYGLRGNLLLTRDVPDKMGKRYTAAQRETRDRVALIQSPSLSTVQADFTGDTCRR